MKFIHKISKITSYIIQICLLVAVLASSGLASSQLGKVLHGNLSSATLFEGTRLIYWKQVNGLYGFKKLINDPNTLPNAKEHYKKETGEMEGQMVGIAAFFDKGQEEQPTAVYVTQKEKGDSKANHNPESGGHPLNMGPTEHTERQLVAGVLAMKSGIAKSYNMNLPTKNKMLGTLSGELHTFLSAGPCSKRNKDNNNFSCIDYFKHLGTLVPKCKLHIYFNTINLGNDINQNPQKMKPLISGVIKMFDRAAIRSNALLTKFLRNKDKYALQKASTIIEFINGGWNDYAYSYIINDFLTQNLGITKFIGIPLGNYKSPNNSKQTVTIIPKENVLLGNYNSQNSKGQIITIIDRKSLPNNIITLKGGEQLLGNYFKMTSDGKIQYNERRGQTVPVWRDVPVTEEKYSKSLPIRARAQTMVNDLRIPDREIIPDELYYSTIFNGIKYERIKNDKLTTGNNYMIAETESVPQNCYKNIIFHAVNILY